MTQIEEFIRYVQRVYLEQSEKNPGAISPQSYSALIRILRDFEAKVRAGEGE